jgi:VanZ family protein
MSLLERFTPGIRHKIFLGYAALITVLFVLPVPATPLSDSRYADKVVHFGIFLGFALLFYVDRHWRVWWTFVMSVAFAGGIELAQWLLPYREGDWWDLVAGAAGAGLGAVLAVMLGQGGRLGGQRGSSN